MCRRSPLAWPWPLDSLTIRCLSLQSKHVVCGCGNPALVGAVRAASFLDQSFPADGDVWVSTCVETLIPQLLEATRAAWALDGELPSLSFWVLYIFSLSIKAKACRSCLTKTFQKYILNESSHYDSQVMWHYSFFILFQKCKYVWTILVTSTKVTSPNLRNETSKLQLKPYFCPFAISIPSEIYPYN